MTNVRFSGQLRHLLFILGLFSFACLLLARLLYLYLGDPARYPINTIKVVANFNHVTHTQIEQILDAYRDKSFFSLPTQQLYKTLSQLSWIDEVEIERIFPDTIKVTLKEKKPIVRFNHFLVTEKEQAFVDPAADGALQSLPLLVGPPQDLHVILEAYQKINLILAQSDLHVERLTRRENQAWSLTLQNGVHLKLGKQEIIERVERFQRAYAILAEKPGTLVSVDLRYPKGMAVKWQQPPPAPTTWK